MSFEIKYNDQPTPHGMHTHTYYEMLYVLSGTTTITVRNRAYECGPGSLIFLNPFDEHASHPLELPYKRYYLLIPLNELKAFHNNVLLLSVFRFHGEQFPYVVQVGEQKARFDFYFSMLMDVQREGGTFADPRMEALMTLILTDTHSMRPDLFIPANQLSFLPIQDIMNELDVSFCAPFSLQELAGKYHVSPGCLSAHFRRTVGISPMQYVTQSRMQRARLLLLNSELSINEIAVQCGYPDVSNFVRRFRLQFQQTPLQFRQKHQGRQL